MPRHSTKIEITCLHCGTKFLAYRFHNRPGREPEERKFCSLRCHYDWHTVPTEVRFKANLAAPDANGCIIWTGGTNRGGYGVIPSRVKKNLSPLAHRIAWELANGPIPDGMCVLHKCDNPPCCNVEHLFLGTLGDNNRDCVRKNRHRGAKVPKTTVVCGGCGKSFVVTPAFLHRKSCSYKCMGKMRENHTFKPCLNCGKEFKVIPVRPKAKYCSIKCRAEHSSKSPDYFAGVKLGKLTPDQVREIRRRYAEGESTQYKLADEFGMTQGAISDIVNRRRWKHI